MEPLSLHEHAMISEDVNDLISAIDDDVFDKTEQYSIYTSDEDGSTNVDLFDADGNLIKTLNTEDFDTAIVAMQSVFDLDDVDMFDYKTIEDEKHTNPLDVDPNGGAMV